nr:hypothetical protein [uncultured Pseudodesulfovibrio sp.]
MPENWKELDAKIDAWHAADWYVQNPHLLELKEGYLKNNSSMGPEEYEEVCQIILKRHHDRSPIAGGWRCSREEQVRIMRNTVHVCVHELKKEGRIPSDFPEDACLGNPATEADLQRQKEFYDSLCEDCDSIEDAPRAFIRKEVD